MWANEEHDYNYARQGFHESTGHFTQLVWQNTTRLGCGAVKCNNEDGVKGWFVVCEYNPGGNVRGEYEYNVGKAGMSDDGKLGFGSAAPKLGGSLRLLVALVAASALAAVCV